MPATAWSPCVLAVARAPPEFSNCCNRRPFMATTTVALPRSKGGAFLLEQRQPSEIFTPEDFTDEHRAIAKTTENFWNNEVAPHLDAIQHQEPGVAVGILKKSAALGLAAVVVPERFGGMEMD